MTPPPSASGQSDQVAEENVRKPKRRFIELEEVRLHVTVFLDRGGG